MEIVPRATKVAPPAKGGHVRWIRQRHRSDDHGLL